MRFRTCILILGSRKYLCISAKRPVGGCHQDEFKCVLGGCIPENWQCDLQADCFDKSDEANCEGKITGELIRAST